ncbi:nicotinamide-nucleotide amidase [Phycisphaerales bacterium]|nr:nicotinamide-nucleotide amidase [Phycisphaerales bacterium]
MPHEHTTAAILSVGDEITLGQTLDTNGPWLAQRLRDIGIVPVEHVTVPDNLARHAAALRRLGHEVDLIICTGGLGPTADDLTRQAMAQASDDSLVEDPLALAQVEAFFAARAREMPTINRGQAHRPSRGRTLPNLNGTAPGLHGTIGTAEVFCLPGPPGEMKPMFEHHVLPRLNPPSGRIVRTRVLHCFGIGESDLATRLGNLMDRTRSPLVGTTASGGVVSIRLRYEGPAPAVEAEALLDTCEHEARSLAGEFVFGAGEDRLSAVVLRLLRERGETLACVESCTGGLLEAMITETPGSSAAFVGGLVTYANEAKTELAGVPAAVLEFPGPGAVSAECALEMAAGGMDRLKASHCLAITGIAGPEGAVAATTNRAAKPVGTVFIARTSRAAGPDARRFQFPGDRSSVRSWAAVSALGMLRQHLAGLPLVRVLRQVEP